MADQDAGIWIPSPIQYDPELASLTDLTWGEGHDVINEWDGWDRSIDIEDIAPVTSPKVPLEPTTETPSLEHSTACEHSQNQAGADLEPKVHEPSSPDVAIAARGDAADHTLDIFEEADERPLISASPNTEAATCSPSPTSHEAQPSEPPIGNGQHPVALAMKSPKSTNNATDIDSGTELPNIPPEGGVDMDIDMDVDVDVETVLDTKVELPSTTSADTSTAEPPPITNSEQYVEDKDCFKIRTIQIAAAKSPSSTSPLSDTAVTPCLITTTDIEAPDTSPESHPSETPLETKIQTECVASIEDTEGGAASVAQESRSEAEPSWSLPLLSSFWAETVREPELAEDTAEEVQSPHVSIQSLGDSAPEIVPMPTSHTPDLIIMNSSKEPGYDNGDSSATPRAPENMELQLALVSCVSPDRHTHDDQRFDPPGNDTDAKRGQMAERVPNESFTFPQGKIVSCQDTQCHNEALKIREAVDIDNETLQVTTPPQAANNQTSMEPMDTEPATREADEIKIGEQSVHTHPVTDVHSLYIDTDNKAVAEISQRSDVTSPPTPGAEEFELNTPHLEEAHEDNAGSALDMYSQALPVTTPLQEDTECESYGIERQLVEALNESDAHLKEENEKKDEGEIAATEVPEQPKNRERVVVQEDTLSLDDDDSDLSDAPSSPVLISKPVRDGTREEQVLGLPRTNEASTRTQADEAENDSQHHVGTEHKVDPIPKNISVAAAPITPESPSRVHTPTTATKLKRPRSTRPKNPSSTKKKDKDFKFYSDDSGSDEVPLMKRPKKGAVTPKKSKAIDGDSVKSDTVCTTRTEEKKSSKSGMTRELNALLEDEKKFFDGKGFDISGTKRAAAMKGHKGSPQPQEEQTGTLSTKVEGSISVAPIQKSPSPTPVKEVSPFTKIEELPSTTRNPESSTLNPIGDTAGSGGPVFRDPFSGGIINLEAGHASGDIVGNQLSFRTTRNRTTLTPALVESNAALNQPVFHDPFAGGAVSQETEQPLTDTSADNPVPARQRRLSYETPYEKRTTRADRKAEEQRKAEKERSTATATCTSTPTPASQPKKSNKKATPASAPTRQRNTNARKGADTPTTAPKTRSRGKPQTPAADSDAEAEATPSASPAPRTRGQKAAASALTKDKAATPATDETAKKQKRKAATRGVNSPAVSPPSKRTRAGQAKADEAKKHNTRGKASRKTL